MTPAEFLNWRKSLRLTQKEAGDKLGLSRRTVINYEAGDSEIPKTVELACAAVTMGFHDYNGEEVSN